MLIGNNQKIFLPRSLNDALNILRKHPGLMIMAGGSDIQTSAPIPITRDILALGSVEELKRVYRSGDTLEIGSMVNLERLTRLKKGVTPQGLLEMVFSIPFPHIRSIATIGGSILADSRHISAYHYFDLADARVELKRPGGGRWLSPGKLRETGQANGEILTRIRLPLFWNRQAFRTFYSRETQTDYGFCALASVQDGILERIRISYLFPGLKSFYNRYLESLIIGHRLPLPLRELQHFLQKFASMWKDSENWEQTDAFMRARLQNLSAWFINSLASADIS